jgi:hypothetical protein
MADTLRDNAETTEDDVHTAEGGADGAAAEPAREEAAAPARPEQPAAPVAGDREQVPASRAGLLLLTWLWVAAPFAYGVYELILTATKLFG